MSDKEISPCDYCPHSRKHCDIPELCNTRISMLAFLLADRERLVGELKKIELEIDPQISSYKEGKRDGISRAIAIIEKEPK